MSAIVERIRFCGLTVLKKKYIDQVKYCLFGLPLLSIRKHITHTCYSLFGLIPVYYQFRNKFVKQGMICECLCSVIPGRRRRKKYSSLLCQYLFPKNKFKVNFQSENFSPFNIDDEVLLEELRGLGTFTYIPNPGNMGDCLIAKATYDFFDRNHLNYRLYSGQCADTVVYGGGGIWVKNLYAKAYAKSILVMKQAKKVVILPSSVHECTQLVEILDDRFVVFCRDKRTFEYLISQNTTAKILMSHDMALRMTTQALQGELCVSYERYKSLLIMQDRLRGLGRVAYFFRDDVEKKFNFESQFDLSAQYGSKRMEKEEVSYASMVMLTAVDLFDVVVTDRLHVGIAATLMGKEVYLFDNNYGKISGVYENSLLSRPNVHLCQELPSEFPKRSTATTIFMSLTAGMEHTDS